MLNKMKTYFLNKTTLVYNKK